MAKNRIYGQFTTTQLDNHKLTLGAAEEVTYRINESGSDSASSPFDIFFNFGRAALKITIRATVQCNITEFNGKVQKSPLTIGAGVNTIESECDNFKIVATGATVLEVTVR